MVFQNYYYKSKKIRALIGNLIYSFFSCKKVINSIHPENIDLLETQVRLFVKAKSLQFNKAVGTKLQETLNDIDFSRIGRRPYIENIEIFVAPLKTTNVKSFLKKSISQQQQSVKSNGTTTSITNITKHAITKVVFFVKKEEIIGGEIIEVSAPQLNKSEIENDFHTILSGKKKFTGHQSINSLDRRFIKDWEFVNGKVLSGAITKTKPKDASNSNTISTALECFNRFLVTTYYDNYGNYLYETELLLYSFCRNNEEEMIDHIQRDDLWGSPILPVDSTCAQNQRMAGRTDFKEFMKELLDSCNTSPNEWAYYMSKNSSGSYTFGKKEGTSTSINIQGLNKIDILVHGHRPGHYRSFSLEDLGAFYQQVYYLGNVADTTNFMFGMITSEGSLQILRIDNAAIFSAFAEQNLSNQGFLNFYTTHSANYDPSHSTHDAKMNFLRIFSNSGLSLYEIKFDNWDDGFTKNEYIPPSTVTLPILKTSKCK